MRDNSTVESAEWVGWISGFDLFLVAVGLEKIVFMCEEWQHSCYYPVAMSGLEMKDVAGGAEQVSKAFC